MPDFADRMAATGFMAMGFGIIVVVVLILLAFYVFLALALMRIGNKLRYEYSWLAWIPIANIFMVASLAGLPAWVPAVLVVGLVIPFLNYIVASCWAAFVIYCVLQIAKKLGKPDYYCALMYVPLLNLWVMYDMAWGAQPVTAQTTTTWEPPAGQAPPPPPPPPPPAE